ncbi:hypothetical protein FSP39_016685 [Pinctada imbricata]|uniref:Integrin beta n=1 Tax=Pinctada imbricata TaxID=66713 RepID=A0AA88YP30_PINIB|nr:hypothetical protein FSP39_016685 [Pinctada imbricata]
MTVRPNDPKTFTLTFRLAENYPVDLYYLMDLSNSMADDKKKLADLGVLIATDMNKITKNFKLGFGSFVDKVVMPYVSTAPSKIARPCDNCEPAYGFKNQLKLDADANKFRDQVNKAQVSGNLDAPEGGFDAIMQAVSCDGEIGWRNQSRRMLLFSTDAGFHYAGDGKLGGIIKPNDGQCHMSNNLYTESSNQDYPSISQVAARVKEKNVNVIFAVTKDQVQIYKQLEPFIAGSETGELASDSSNIVQLVRENYLKITSKVELVVENSDDVVVTFRTKCKGDVEENTNKCLDLKIGDMVTFNVSITAKECPAGTVGNIQRTLKIKPVGLSDTLEVRMNVLCSCNCETPQIEEANKNSPQCNSSGTFVCGVCKCNPGYYGKDCSCPIGQRTLTDLQNECKPKGSTLDIYCSDRGDCICGKCECRARSSNSAQRYSGKFCECDDYSCPFYKDLICGGSERGNCKCGKCYCNDGWSGPECGCKNDTSACMVKKGDKYLECNGKGRCECGACVCTSKEFYGPTCEDCTTCLEVCKKEKPCVQCHLFQSGPLRTAVTKCPPEVNVLAIVLGVIGGIVAVGLALLLIWKLVTTISDKRELARFEKETRNAKWDTGENPIYKQATSTFKNPTYAGK